jgi:hypothetical protein
MSRPEELDDELEEELLLDALELEELDEDEPELEALCWVPPQATNPNSIKIGRKIFFIGNREFLLCASAPAKPGRTIGELKETRLIWRLAAY